MSERLGEGQPDTEELDASSGSLELSTSPASEEPVTTEKTTIQDRVKERVDAIRERFHKETKEERTQRLQSSKEDIQSQLDVFEIQQKTLTTELKNAKTPEEKKFFEEELQELNEDITEQQTGFARNILERMSSGEKVSDDEVMLLMKDLSENEERSVLAELAVSRHGFKTFQKAMGKLNVKSVRAEDLVVQLDKENSNPWIKEELKKIGIGAGVSAATVGILGLMGGPVAWAGILGGVAGGSLARLGVEYWRHRQISKDNLGEKLVSDLLGTIQYMKTEGARALEAAESDDHNARIDAIGRVLSAAASAESRNSKQYKDLDRKAGRLKLGLGVLGAVGGSLLGSFLAQGSEVAQGLSEMSSSQPGEHIRIFHDSSGNAHIAPDASVGHEVYKTNEGVWRFMVEQSDVNNAIHQKALENYHFVSMDGPSAGIFNVPENVDGLTLLHNSVISDSSVTSALSEHLSQEAVIKSLEVAAVSGAATAATELVDQGSHFLTNRQIREDNRALIDMLEAHAVRVQSPRASRAEVATEPRVDEAASTVMSLPKVGEEFDRDGKKYKVLEVETLPDGTPKIKVEEVAEEEKRFEEKKKTEVGPEQIESSFNALRKDIEFSLESTHSEKLNAKVGPIVAAATVELFHYYKNDFDSLDPSARDASKLSFEEIKNDHGEKYIITNQESGVSFVINKNKEGEIVLFRKHGKVNQRINHRGDIIEAFQTYRELMAGSRKEDKELKPAPKKNIEKVWDLVDVLAGSDRAKLKDIGIDLLTGDRDADEDPTIQYVAPDGISYEIAFNEIDKDKKVVVIFKVNDKGRIEKRINDGALLDSLVSQISELIAEKGSVREEVKRSEVTEPPKEVAAKDTEEKVDSAVDFSTIKPHDTLTVTADKGDPVAYEAYKSIIEKIGYRDVTESTDLEVSSVDVVKGSIKFIHPRSKAVRVIRIDEIEPFIAGKTG
jgi:ribosomal protein L18E